MTLNILITGTTCVGKSTLGSELLKSLSDYELIESKAFLEENNLLEEFDQDRQSWIYSPDKLDEKLEEYLKTKNNVLFIGAPALVNENYIELVIVLVCLQPKKLESRLIERKYSKAKILENVEAEVMGEIQGTMESHYPIEKILVLDSCDNNIEALVSLIMERLKR